MRAVVVGLALGLVLGACGDHFYPPAPDLVPVPDLAIVAHQDDDLLFMQPDLMERVQAGTGVTILYVTAGDAGHDVAYIEDRQFGTMSAYGSVADDALADWRCGWIELDNHPAQHCRLEDAKLSLVFLGYPDGGVDGEFAGSLRSLWQGNITTATTKSRQPSTYTQPDLIAAVGDVISQSSPSTLHVLDVASTHGHDHSDHMITAALALLGVARSGTSPRIVSYRGYNIADEPVTKSPTFVAPQIDALEAYDACATRCSATCGGICTSTDPAHAAWASRRYAIGFRSQLAEAAIASADGSGCVAIGEDAMATLVDCAAAPAWTLTAGGELATAGSAGFACLEALPTGELTGAACDPGSDGPAPPERRMFVDDDGHIWGALVPVPVADMSFQHLDCVAPSGGRPRLVLCGGSDAPTWTFARDATAANAIAVPDGARPVLADIDGDNYADLVYDDGVRLFAARGLGDGTFAQPQVLGALAVAPDSLTVADLDGDGLGDACGHAVGGGAPACVFSRMGYQSSAGWSPALSPLSPVDDAGDVSLAAVGDQLCAVTGSTSIDCAGHGAATADRLSDVPPPGALVWFASLTGNGIADFCTATSSGAACGLREEAGVSRTPNPWSYASHGIVDAPVLAPGATAIADVDGDGFPDLCGLAGDHVACARGQGHGFGPTLSLAPLAGSATDRLALGDLDGDGHADACVVTAAGSVTCQLSP